MRRDAYAMAGARYFEHDHSDAGWCWRLHSSGIGSAHEFDPCPAQMTFPTVGLKKFTSNAHANIR